MKFSREVEDRIRAALAAGEAQEGSRKEVARECYIVLPWGPTMNTYWRHVGAKVHVSREGVVYRRKVCTLTAGMNTFGSQLLRVYIYADPPDRRGRDLDNLLKPVLDALMHAGLYDDDSQIIDLRIRRDPHGSGTGTLQVTITAAE